MSAQLRSRVLAVAALAVTMVTAESVHPLAAVAQPREEYQEPLPLRTVDPLLSPLVFQGGTVVLRVLVSVSGEVSDIEVISGFPALTQPVIDAVSQWQFTPARLDRRPIAATTTVVVHVALQRAIAPPGA
ncbi:MAG: energy transducer TonB [Vicinamibacterales bacterium]